MTGPVWNPMAQQYEPKPVSLADFLLQRIAEDEMRARPVVGEEAHPGDTRLRLARIEPHDALTITSARVLAECQAKRLIIEREKVPMVDVTNLGDRERRFVPGDPRGRGDTSPVLRLLALPFSSHPDYDEAWKP